MSGDVLSNDEISALVQAAREGTIPEPPRAGSTRRPKRVHEVDFSRPTKFTQDQMRRISRGHEGFCRTAQSQLSAEFRTPVQLEVLNVDQQTWSSALGEIPQPSLDAVLSTSSGARLLFTIEQPAMLTLVERLLGGTAEAVVPNRVLTDIEHTLATRVFGMVVAPLSRTWHELLGTELALQGLETQQTNLQLAPSSEPTLSVTMELEMQRLSATMTLLIPHRAIEHQLEQLSTGQYGEHYDGTADEEVEELVRSALRGVEVEVRAEIGSRELTIEDLLALAPGDVVKLAPASAGGTLYADSVAIHRTRPGRSGNRRAVEILDRIEGP
jgi:flagellar motor switch protein FliM